MYYVYAITSCVDGRIYVGFSHNLTRRIQEHNNGKTKSTKGYRPWKLFYYEQVNTRCDARKREKQLKSGSGKEFLKSIRDKWNSSSDTCLSAGRE